VAGSIGPNHERSSFFEAGIKMMHSPFEELEYLVDFLPEEGETVVVTRRAGELVCEPHGRETSALARDGVFDPVFYGRLVQSNERLRARASRPIWITLVALFWTCVAIHAATGLNWQGWFWDVGLALMAFGGGYAWVRSRRSQLYCAQIEPVLERLIRERRLDRYAVIGSIRQHVELRFLLEEMSRSVD